MIRLLLVISAFLLFALMPLLLTAQENLPKEGVLTGDNVRVRTGAGKNHKILLKLKKGTKVKVVGVEGDWYKIDMPSQLILWIIKDYIKEVKQGQQLKGEVTRNRVNVRTGIEVADKPVAQQVNKGDKVNIVGSKGNWYKISPPEGFTAYIYAEFVDLGEEPATRTPPDTEPEQKTGGNETDALQARLAKVKEEIHKKREEVEAIKEAIDEKEQEETELEEKLKYAVELYEGYLEKVKELRQKQNELMEKLPGRKPRLRYVAEGYVDDIGRYINPPPATHQLRVTWDSPPCYYLRSADASINLDSHIRKRVGVMGEIVEEEWGGKKIEVIKVTRVDRLEN